MTATLPLIRADRVDEDSIRALPKAEVHVHLEGGFELVDLIDMAKVAGVPLPGPARIVMANPTEQYTRELLDAIPGRRTP